MKIGIIGCGIIGGAIGKGFNMLGHDITYHDIKFNTTIDIVLNTEIIYVCVPTPSTLDGDCDLSIVYQTISDLKSKKYSGIIALKSTSTPGTTESIIKKYNDRDICFVPEFLRERCAFQDFISNHSILAIGCHTDRAWESVCKSHAWLPKNIIRMTPTEAEILKYYSNTFNALRVVFANIMFEICSKLNSDYSKILSTFLLKKTASSDYLKCSQDMRGYGGMCLPKDVKAMANLCKKLGLPFNLLDTINNDNNKIKKTVFDGMRN
jgi:UDPglucose 6-dehydrogenase